jgi:aspartate/methionine/tyrosine aminotransferase
MPTFPQRGARAQSVTDSPYEVLRPRIMRLQAEGRLCPLHLGDSFLLPPEAARRIDLDDERLHRYCPVPGMPAYRRAVAEWFSGQLGWPVAADQVFAATGCTGSLTAAVTSVFDPGDEVLVVTPSWPLIFGILSSQAVAPVGVPVGLDGWPDADPGAFGRRLRAACTDRTAGIYLSDPNNPGGFVFPPEHLGALLEVAEECGLWVLVDVVYKDLILDHTPWSLPRVVAERGAADRLLMAGSFSKSHLLAGHRAGFVVAPEAIAGTISREVCNRIYHASTSAQEMAVAALEAGEGEIAKVRESYVAGRDAACAALHREIRSPQAGAFLFLDLRRLAPTGEEMMALLTACLDEGVSLAPGQIFGRGFEGFARLCYTASPIPVVEEGIRRLETVLDRWG